jgi:hypothetical protein
MRQAATAPSGPCKCYPAWMLSSSNSKLGCSGNQRCHNAVKQTQMVTQDRAQVVNRIEAVLGDANIKLSLRAYLINSHGLITSAQVRLPTWRMWELRPLPAQGLMCSHAHSSKYTSGRSLYSPAWTARIVVRSSLSN